jgi:hypothetical protein
VASWLERDSLRQAIRERMTETPYMVVTKHVRNDTLIKIRLTLDGEVCARLFDEVEEVKRRENHE